MDWSVVVTIAIAGAICVQLGRWLERREKKELKTWTFVCRYTECGFHMKSTDKALLDLLAETHMRERHGD